MYISCNWLKNYIPDIYKIEPKFLQEKISSSLAEVEKIIEKGSELDKIIAAKAIDIQKHPKSKKHKIAIMDIGEKEEKKVVFTPSQINVQKDHLYPVCLAGGTIYSTKDPLEKENSVQIEETKIETVISEGVICSLKTLGISNSTKETLHISNDIPAGYNLLHLLKDRILEIDNKSLTHRPDVFSHRGVAREFAAILQMQYIEKEETSNIIGTKEKPVKINIENTKLCKRFTALSCQNIKISPSPTWLQIHLYYIGSGPINNLVDISNYIMFDIGQPLHMYDYDKIAKNTLTVKEVSRSNTEFLGLNKKKYKLPEKAVVITDGDAKVQGLAGIMGSENSEISDNTKNVIIEAATWDMFSIRQTSKKIGLTTDASIRYSKDLDETLSIEGLKRAAILTEDLGGGEIASDITDIGFDENGRERNFVTINLRKINRLLGTSIEKSTIVHILKSLNFQIEDEKSIPNDIDSTDSSVQIIIPPYRKDISIEEDIIEEIIRIHGYENLPIIIPHKTIEPAEIHPDTKLIRKIKTLLIASGLDEMYSYSFIGGQDYERCNLNPKKLVRIINPLSPDLEYVRGHIAPSLLIQIQQNLSFFKNFSYFEIAKTSVKKANGDLPEQNLKISAVLVSQEGEENNVFFELKQSINLLFERLRISPKYINLNMNQTNDDMQGMFHPNKSAILQQNNELIGLIGILHPKVKQNLKLQKCNVALFELDYNTIKTLKKTQTTYKKLQNFPEAHRDLTIISKPRTEVGSILDTIYKGAIAHLETIEFLDIFSKKSEKRITLRFVLSNPNSTLKEQDINSSMENIERIIEQDLNLKVLRN